MVCEVDSRAMVGAGDPDSVGSPVCVVESAPRAGGDEAANVFRRSLTSGETVMATGGGLSDVR